MGERSSRPDRESRTYEGFFEGKGPWSEEEDAILRSLVEKFGPKKWSTIASYINGRIGKQVGVFQRIDISAASGGSTTSVLPYRRMCGRKRRMRF